MIKVRSHTRKKKNGVTIVKKHLRKAKSRFGIKTPVTVDVNHKSNQSDSLAHHALHFDPKKKKPAKHELNFDQDKIRKSGRNFEHVVKHEIGHLVDAELAAKKGKMKKATDTYSKSGAVKLSKSRRSAKEKFADKYAKEN